MGVSLIVGVRDGCAADVLNGVAVSEGLGVTSDVAFCNARSGIELPHAGRTSPIRIIALATPASTMWIRWARNLPFTDLFIARTTAGTRLITKMNSPTSTSRVFSVIRLVGINPRFQRLLEVINVAQSAASQLW